MLLKFGYITLSLAMLLVIWWSGFKVINITFADNTKRKKKKNLLIIGLLLWQLYIYIIASSGVLQTFELPPRFPIFIIFPAFTFIGVFLYKNRKNGWLDAISARSLTYIQVFRIAVEFLFVFSISAGVLHKNVTIEGYNFDMVFAFTAVIVAYLAFDKQLITKKFVIWWNYLGLAVLASVIFVFISSTYFPSVYGAETSLLPIEFTKYPYILVAGFLMPLAVFLHILSLIKLHRK